MRRAPDEQVASFLSTYKKALETLKRAHDECDPGATYTLTASQATALYRVLVEVAHTWDVPL